MSSESKIAEIVAMFCEAYKQDISPIYFEFYCKALEGYPIEKIQDAAVQIIRTHKYATLPPPAEFIAIIDPPEQEEMIVAEAFKQLEDMMLLRGAYASVEFGDPVIAAVIENMGGWITVCNDVAGLDDQEYKFFRKDFERLYKAFHHKEGLQPKKLIGCHQASNQANGFLTDDGRVQLPDGTTQPQITERLPGDKEPLPQIENRRIDADNPKP